MSDGTPIEAIETGNVSDAADSQHMQAILETINASGADIANGPVASPPPMMPQQPPMYIPMVQPPPHREYVEDDEKPRSPKKNLWSSVFERLRDVLAVSAVFFILSLPVLHTFASRYASWAFAIGGQLSWLGLAVFSLLAGVMFGLYKAGSDILGL